MCFKHTHTHTRTHTHTHTSTYIQIRSYITIHDIKYEITHTIREMCCIRYIIPARKMYSQNIRYN